MTAPARRAHRFRRSDAGALVAIAAAAAAVGLPALFSSPSRPSMASKPNAAAVSALVSAYHAGYRAAGAHPNPARLAASFEEIASPVTSVAHQPSDMAGPIVVGRVPLASALGHTGGLAALQVDMAQPAARPGFFSVGSWGPPTGAKLELAGLSTSGACVGVFGDAGKVVRTVVWDPGPQTPCSAGYLVALRP